MLDTSLSVSSSVIAFVTTVHAALLVIQVQRARGAARVLVAVPSAAFAAFAWILTTPAWLALGLGVHVAWVAALVGLTRPAPGPPADARQAAPTAVTTAGAAAARPSTFVPTTVLAILDEAEAIRTFRLARPDGFDFEAGQFLMVKVDVDGHGIARCYSISSSPAAAYLEISVKRQGVASGALHDTLRPGSTLLVHPPLGRFTVPARRGDELVLLAGGIGITPLVSQVRHLVAAEPTRTVTLLYSFRDARDAAFRAELEWLARRHPQFRLVMTMTGDGLADGCRRGRIDSGLVRETVRDLSRALFLVCGPLPMIDGVRDMLEALGVTSDQIRSEAFEAAAAVAAEAAGVPAGDTAGRLRLALTGSETEVRPSETLLDAAERAGGRIASFCRAGICGTCRTRLVSGEVRCTGEALSGEDRAGGYVLPCAAWTAGDCVLEA